MMWFNISTGVNTRMPKQYLAYILSNHSILNHYENIYVNWFLVMVLAWKSWKVWAGTPEPVGPVCLDPPPPPPRFAPPPDTRPGLAPPSLQKEEEEEAEELLVEEPPALSTGMTVFYYRQQGLKTMLTRQRQERLWWRCGAGVRTLKLVSLYLPQVQHRCRHVHNIMGLKIGVIHHSYWL